MNESLDSILTNEKSAPAAEAPAAPPAKEKEPAAAPAAAAPETAKEPARGTDGKFVAKTEEPAKAPAAPPQDLTDRERAAFAKAADETRKRQALEQRLAALEAKPAAPATPAQPPKAFWDDPEGALKRHQEEIRSETTNTRLNTAELIARSRHTDFDEKVAEFSQLVTQVPGLAQQWLAAQDPAEFAYTVGKNNMLLKQVGSMDALTDKVRKETEASVRAKVEAEYKAKADALEKERAALPPSLSDSRGGIASSGKPVWTGPTSLSDILSSK